ncbi:hypothetical protein GCM10010252_69460 [Streptomyces aureoverticillatus]|nr:hypothetical protein GCM10010252_69460 [Streptomyces aureoverticillatus]
MPSGVMKCFDPDRGVGVIALEDGGEVAAHPSAVHGDAERMPVEGERVCFDLTRDDLGVRADNIRRADPGCCAPAEGSGGRALGAVGEFLLRVLVRVGFLCGRASRPTALDGRRAAAEGKARRVDDADACPWCVKLREAGARDAPTTVVGIHWEPPA